MLNSRILKRPHYLCWPKNHLIYLNENYIKNLLENHFNKKEDNSKKIWNLQDPLCGMKGYSFNYVKKFFNNK